MFAIGEKIRCIVEMEGLQLGKEYTVVAPELILGSDIELVWIDGDSKKKEWHACSAFELVI